MGAAFGGGNNTIFGAGGANSVFVKITTGIAIGFMITSILLVNSYFDHARESQGISTADPLSGSLLPAAPAVEVPAAAAVDVAPQPAAENSSPSNVQKSSAVVEKSAVVPNKAPTEKK